MQRWKTLATTCAPVCRALTSPIRWIGPKSLSTFTVIILILERRNNLILILPKQQSFCLDLDEESYLRVTTPYNDGPREVEAGKSATFVVYIDARPDPIVNWYRDGQLEPINTTSKYVVHRSWGKTYLKIRDASIEDNGVYRLVAISGKERRSVNFSLVVEDRKT